MKKVVKFSVTNFKSMFPGENRQKICHQKSTYFTPKISKIHHLEHLGPLSCNPFSFWLLVAPYCAIPRDYLSDTPLLRTTGFLVSQHGQLGAIPPPPFLSVSSLESIREAEVRYPPPPKGYLSDTCAIPSENKENGCDTPPCDTISKGYCAIWRGISHCAALSFGLLFCIASCILLPDVISSCWWAEVERKIPQKYEASLASSKPTRICTAPCE